MTDPGPQSHVAFTDVGALLSFLNACELSETGRGVVSRSDYETVYYESTDPPTLSVAFRSAAWNAGPLHGGRFHPAQAPSGAAVELNAILQMLPVAASSAEHQPVSTLLVRTRRISRAELAEEEARLYSAWVKIERSEHAQSHFYEYGDGGPDTLRLAVLVNGVGRDFDVRNFEDSHPNLEAFLPAVDPEADSGFLYVRSGYVHSRPQEFHRLYDQLTEDVLVLCEPASSGADAGVRWLAAAYTQVDGVYAIRSGESVRLSWGAENTEVQTLDRSETKTRRITLRQGDQRHSLAALGEVDQRIGGLERSLEDLYARRARTRVAASRDYLAVFAFDQGHDLGPETIPPALEVFLRRSLAELDQYSLVYEPRPHHSSEGRRGAPVGTHYVIADMPMSRPAALAVWCDHTYLCDLRWDGWNLPLFVRTDSSLSVDVEEADIAEKLAALFAEQGVALGEGTLLAEPSGAARSGGPLAFKQLPRGEPLANALAFTNHLGGGVRRARNAANETLEKHTERLDQALQQQVASSDEALRRHAESEVKEFEAHWEKARVRLRELALDRQMIEHVSASIEALLLEFPTSWEQFTRQVFAHWRQLADQKLDARSRSKGAAKRLHEDYLAVSKLLDIAIAESKADEERLEATRKAVLKKIAELKARNEALNRKSEEVRDLHQTAKEEAGKIQATRDALVTVHEATKKELARIKLLRAEAEAVRDELRRKLEELQAEKSALDAAARQIEADSAELSALRKQLREDAPAVAELAGRLERDYRKLRQRAERYVERRRRSWVRRLWPF